MNRGEERIGLIILSIPYLTLPGGISFGACSGNPGGKPEVEIGFESDMVSSSLWPVQIMDEDEVNEKGKIE
ncbi:hypothetical protein EYC80_006187 [Monilinia laxa]|uniref:Uncharacterized protein n=1 Tax=Monilinia laxa TaxID=61186 RepID=A0A5N6KGN0_MONLA|nr:hypothetical protein EYC80_006187 [Monilinia laxa]